jgi:hypothetical protein
MVTSFHHQPKAQHPNSSAIHKLPADYPFAALFDHLVGAGEQCGGHCKIEHPGGLVVDDQFELVGLYDRQVHRACHA